MLRWTVWSSDADIAGFPSWQPRDAGRQEDRGANAGSQTGEEQDADEDIERERALQKERQYQQKGGKRENREWG